MTTISCHHARAAMSKAIVRGHSKDAILIHAKINPLLLAQSNARVNESQMTQLVQHVSELLDDEFMGFTPKPSKKGAFTMMTHSIRRCETLREALLLGIRFYNFFTDDIQTRLIENNDEAIIDITFAKPELDPDHFFTEFWMVLWHRLASWMTGTRILLLETAFAHPEPKHLNELSYTFPGEHRFNAPSNQLKFSAEHLRLPLIRNNKEWTQFLTHAPFDLLSIPGDDQSLQNKIALLIKNASTEALYFPPIKEIAAQLHMSSQTLHRHLKNEATSYQRIKDNIRRDTAMTKLIQDKLPVHKVAELVGFSDSRSFTRAFKQWTGLSPRAYCKFA